MISIRLNYFFFFLLFGYMFVSESFSGEEEPCLSYETINEPNRNVDFGETSLCDKKTLVEGWYRFTGDGGDIIPNYCVKKRSCGTHAPMWMTGSLPTADEGEVERMVCAHWDEDCCKWKNQITVKNCDDDYYVYYLTRAPTCSLRYCVDHSENKTEIFSPNDPCLSNTELNEPDRNVNYKIVGSPLCDGELLEGWYRFVGSGGDIMPTYCVKENSCNTHASMWMEGELPSVEEGQVVRNACAHWNGNCCNWKKEISIKNCNDYYVYYLSKPTSCSLRYCVTKREDLTSPLPSLIPGSISSEYVGEADPCFSYESINDPSRSVDSGKGQMCDKDLIEGWYRFVGIGGGVVPNYCVPKKSCTTQATIWMMGEPPAVNDGIVERTTCANWGNKCCKWESSIKVKNCKDYLVYRLKPPHDCNLRYCTVSIKQQENPCYSHKELDEPTRNVEYGYASLCDKNTLEEGWYRFVGLGGDIMPNYCVKKGTCSTNAGMWMQGELPTLVEGEVERTACASFSGCCEWSSKIKVKNCDGFYVYYLTKPSTCNLRYCSVSSTDPPPTTPPIIIASSIQMKIDPCFSYVEINEPDRYAKNKIDGSLCDKDKLEEGWYRFVGSGGDIMPTYCVDQKSCNTHASMWMDGKLPSAEEGEVERIACAHWDDNCCNWQTDIKVKNCVEYYVYYLTRPLHCSLRYCVDHYPTNVLVDKPIIDSDGIGSTQVALRWNPWTRDHDVGDGPVTLYRVFYKLAAESNYSLCNETSETSLTVSSLQDNTAYDFSVKAYGPRQRWGDYGPSIRVTTPCSDLGPVLNLETGEVTAESIFLVWSKPSGTNCEVHYKVSYQLISRDMCQHFPGKMDIALVTGSFTSHNYTSLEPHSEYRMTVESTGTLGETGKRAAINVATKETGPSGSPRNVQIVNDTIQGGITFSWKPVECGKRYGNITGYEYELKRLNSSAITFQRLPLTTERITLRDLDCPDKENAYSFRIKALRYSGNGNYSKPIIIALQASSEGMVDSPKASAVSNSDSTKAASVGSTGVVIAVGVILIVAIVALVFVIILLCFRQRYNWPGFKKQDSEKILDDMAVSYNKSDKGGTGQEVCITPTYGSSDNKVETSLLDL